ncbi:hypothetical protein NG752_00590 [Aliarcobacter cryaerophilus]|uniref:hypothetical protein n=1 Tax=Aliarcobacter cryaerophilus TaxID=28198 RepID=UPI003DA4EA58
MKTKEIWIVAYIYSIICFCIFFMMKEIEHKKLHKDLQQAKSIAVEYHDISESLYLAVDGLNSHIDKMHKLDKLVQDLATVPRDMQKSVIANCYNESNLNYEAVHKGKFDKTTKGLCGIKTEWIHQIPELNENNINSLYGGYLVLSYLVNETGSLEKALMRYKGSIKNTLPVEHTIELKRLINL